MQWLDKFKECQRKQNLFKVPCASVTPDGIPQIHQLAYHTTMKDEPILLFSGSIRNPQQIALIKSKQSHSVLFNFSSFEFTIRGKIYVICSPSQSHRLGTPSHRLLQIQNPEEFWESERLKVWQSISKQYRATFTWPVSGETIKAPETTYSAYKDVNVLKRSYGMDVGYKYTSLDCNNTGLFQQNTEEPILQLAYDNFCMFALKCTKVEMVELKQIPVKHIFDVKHNWSPHQVTP